MTYYPMNKVHKMVDPKEIRMCLIYERLTGGRGFIPTQSGRLFSSCCLSFRRGRYVIPF